MTKPIARWAACVFAAGMYVLNGLKLPAAEDSSSASSVARVSAPRPSANPPANLSAALGIIFVQDSTSKLILDREGKRYIVDLVNRKVTEIRPSENPPASGPVGRPDPPSRPSQPMAAAQATKKEVRQVYEPGDDSLFSLPTGRRVNRHGFYVNFTHRFALDSAFSGTARGGALLGLDGFSLSSFGFRYGVTKKFSVSIYRSPTFIGRPIQLMAAYNFSDEHDGQLFNSAFRFSVEGHNDFSKNFTENFEGIFSRSLTPRAQIYVVPTVSLNNRRLPSPDGFESKFFPDLPGYNTFSLGVGGSLDIRRTVALVAEVIPTLSGGRNLGIHRPAYSFGIQKKIWRHAFTLGFTNSPGTTVAQRSGTRAAYLGSPSADTPSGFTIGFDLTRQIY